VLKQKDSAQTSMHLSTKGVVRGIIYGRVSTDEQTENFSLETQVTNATRMAQQFNISLSSTALLDDYTGTKLDRPELIKLRDLIRRKKIDAVIINTSDRLSRKPAHGEILLDEMAAHGVRLFIVYHNRELDITEDCPDRDLLLQEMIFNRRWRVMLLEAMQRGRKGKAARGLYIGQGYSPFGYYKERHGRVTVLIVDEEEAALVRLIYYWYTVERVGVSEIQRRLHGIPSPLERKPELDKSKLYLVKTAREPGDWSTNSIYWILKNEAYAGSLTMYEDPDNPVTIEVPAIIDRDMWEAAQQIRRDGKVKSKRNTKGEYLMQTRLRCNTCNYIMGMQPCKPKDKVFRYYYCPSRKNHYSKPRCGLPYFRQEIVDAAVWDFISTLIRHPKTLGLKLDEAKHELEVRNQSLRDRVTQIDTILKRQERKLNLLLEEYAETSSEPVKVLFQRLKVETEQLFNDLNEEREQLEQELQANSIDDSYIREWSKYAEEIEVELEGASFEKKREILDSLNMTGTATVEDGVKVLYLHISTYTERIPLDDLQFDSSPSRCAGC
jgi:site-specific DNA recombinase